MTLTRRMLFSWLVGSTVFVTLTLACYRPLGWMALYWFVVFTLFGFGFMLVWHSVVEQWICKR